LSQDDLARLRERAEELQRMLVQMQADFVGIEDKRRRFLEELAHMAGELDVVLAKIPGPKAEGPGLFEEDGS